jgi:hypothetical protein
MVHAGVIDLHVMVFDVHFMVIGVDVHVRVIDEHVMVFVCMSWNKHYCLTHKPVSLSVRTTNNQLDTVCYRYLLLKSN